MINYYATADAHGMISHLLEAASFGAARRELEISIGNGTGREWIDRAETDLETALGVSFDSMTYKEAYAAAYEAGATCKLAAESNACWEIFAVDG